MRVFIANNYIPAMRTDRSFVDAKFLQLIALISQRMLWFAHPGDVIVTPAPIPEIVLNSYQLVTGRDPHRITCVVPDLGSPQIIDEEILLSKELLKTIAVCHPDVDIEVVPYIYDPYVEEFTNILGKRAFIRSTNFMKEGGVRLLNHKGYFRSLAEKVGVMVPAGSVCRTVAEVASAVRVSLRRCGGVMLKQPLSAGGTGNCVITYNDPQTIHGAGTVFNVSDENDISTKIADMDLTQTIKACGDIVVEDYISSTESIYAEYEIKDEEITPLSVGDQFIGNIFGGISIPSKLNPLTIETFVKGSSRIARSVHELGYRGYMDIDGIVTDTGKVLFNEGNYRFAGSTHVHEIACQLLGPRYMNFSHVIGKMGCVGDDAGVVLDAFGKDGLLYDRSTKEGIILTAERCNSLQEYEVIIIGRTTNAAKKILSKVEGKFVLNSNSAPAVMNS